MDNSHDDVIRQIAEVWAKHAEIPGLSLGNIALSEKILDYDRDSIARREGSVLENVDKEFPDETGQ